MASGIFIVPILTIVAGVDVHLAIGASIVSVIACSCGSAVPLLKARLTNVRLAIVLETATTLGAASGVVVSGDDSGFGPLCDFRHGPSHLRLADADAAGGSPRSLLMARQRPVGREA